MPELLPLINQGCLKFDQYTRQNCFPIAAKISMFNTTSCFPVQIRNPSHFIYVFNNGNQHSGTVSECYCWWEAKLFMCTIKHHAM